MRCASQYTTIESTGSISLLSDPQTDRSYAQESSGEIIPITFNNVQVGNATWPGWDMLGADTNQGINEVAWSNGSSTWVSQHDADWNATNGSHLEATSATFKTLEKAFQQDLNKDGLI